MVLDAAHEEDYRSCVYLRRIHAKQTSMDDLFHLVFKLAYDCRCGACFDCLHDAGSRNA